MKKPNFKKLKINKEATLKIRSAMAKATKIKITINVDLETLQAIRKISDETGVPYQNLLNKMLRDSLDSNKSQESRLDQLEREINLIKKKISA